MFRTAREARQHENPDVAVRLAKPVPPDPLDTPAARAAAAADWAAYEARMAPLWTRQAQQRAADQAAESRLRAERREAKRACAIATDEMVGAEVARAEAERAGDLAARWRAGERCAAANRTRASAEETFQRVTLEWGEVVRRLRGR